MKGNRNIKKIISFSFKDYLFFISFVFFITGFLLLFYCLLKNVNPLQLEILSSPVHYLMVGFVCFGLYLIEKYL